MLFNEYTIRKIFDFSSSKRKITINRNTTSVIKKQDYFQQMLLKYFLLVFSSHAPQHRRKPVFPVVELRTTRSIIWTIITREICRQGQRNVLNSERSEKAIAFYSSIAYRCQCTMIMWFCFYFFCLYIR